ncbi:MAG TPA: hypothetical protein VNO84_02115 [Burkholderiaceae bacterium]|nr:hypothetical protein [Burkholderiaceae bacterium]
MNTTKPPSDWKQLTEATEAEAPGRLQIPPAAQKRSLALPVLFVVCLVLLLGAWFGPFVPWPVAPTDRELENGRRAALMLAAQALHDYAQMHQGVYPARLDEALVLQLGQEIEYSVGPDGFELRLASGHGPPLTIKGR